MVQLWVNLPAKDKMSAPKYQALTNEQFSKYPLPENGGIVEVISGHYKESKGPAYTFTPVFIQNAKLNKGGKADFKFPASYNTALLVIEGNIKINDTYPVPTDHFVLFKNDGEEFKIEASEKSIVLVMSGEPILEPIAPYGPFVMNTREELIQAYEDLKDGKFGFLED